MWTLDSTISPPPLKKNTFFVEGFPYIREKGTRKDTSSGVLFLNTREISMLTQHKDIYCVSVCSHRCYNYASQGSACWTIFFHIIFYLWTDNMWDLSLLSYGKVISQILQVVCILIWEISPRAGTDCYWIAEFLVCSETYKYVDLF